jgi:uncharacterized protein YndB with AHSA1/START domain
VISWLEHRKRKARRRRLRRLLGGLMVALAGLLLAGMLVPREYTSIARSALGRSPDEVWRILTDLDGFALWRSDLVRIERLPHPDGRPIWREVGRGREVIVQLAESERPHRLVVRRRRAGEADLPELTFILRSSLQGTDLTLVLRDDLPNPLRRILARLGVGKSPGARLVRDLEGRLTLPLRQASTHGDVRSGQ